MILAIDPSLTCGFAFGGPNDHRPATGTWRLPEGPENRYRALLAMRQSVLRLLCDPKVTLFVIEAPMLQITRKHGAYALRLLVELTGIACEVAQERGVPIREIAASTWRAHFLGKGNLSTEDAKNGAMRRCEQLKWPYTDHNSAEACGLWHYMACETWAQWPPAKVPVKKRAA